MILQVILVQLVLRHCFERCWLSLDNARNKMGWTRGCKRTVVLGGIALGGTGTVVITTGLGCNGGFRVGRVLPKGR